MSSEEMRASFSELAVDSQTSMDKQTGSSGGPSSEEGAQVTCFTEDLHDVTLHFQIIRFSKQIYAWIGCNTAKFGHLYAAATTRPDNRAAAERKLVEKLRSLGYIKSKACGVAGASNAH